MLEHIVLLKLKEGVSESKINDMYSNVLGMKNKIPGIASITIGLNNSPENKNKGYTHGFTVRFVNSDSRDNYLSNPTHHEIARKYIIPIADDILVFDYTAG